MDDELLGDKLQEIFDACLSDMTSICDDHKADFVELGGDPEEFKMRVLEQWRPW